MSFPGLRIAGYHLSALILAIGVVLGVGASSQVFGQANPKGSPVEQVLIKLENDWNDASMKRDVVVLGRILADIRRDAEAVDEYREALAITPDDADVHLHLGLAFQRLGRIA